MAHARVFVGSVATACAVLACQTLLDFRAPSTAPSGDGSVDGIADVDAIGDAGGGRREPRVIRSLGPTTSGIAAGGETIAWVEGTTLLRVAKSSADVDAMPLAIDCRQPTLVGPRIHLGRTYVICGNGLNGYVVLTTVTAGAQGGTPTSSYDQASNVHGFAVTDQHVGLTLTTLTTGSWCSLQVDQTNVPTACTPGAAAANLSTFFFGNEDGGISQLDWTGAPKGEAFNVPGFVRALEATNDEVFWTSTAAVGRSVIQTREREVVDDGGAGQAIAVYANRIAFLRDGRVYESSVSLSAPKKVSRGTTSARLLAMDEDGIYFVDGVDLWVAPTCPGRFCAEDAD